MIIGITKINIPDMAKALAIGQSLFTKNSSQIIFPKYSLSLPPSSSGITNSPTTGIKTNILPATIPGKDNGIMTLKKVLKGRATFQDSLDSLAPRLHSRWQYILQSD